jgi:UDP-glucose 4-epimerase
MKYLVTGGAGFIGSHLVDSLLKRGDEVIVLDDFSTGNRTNLKLIEKLPQLSLIDGSILDRTLVDTWISQVDGCFHMAAAVGVQKILLDPITSIKTNIHGTENVLDAASKNQIPVLLASTSEIYGKNSSGLLNENSDRILGSPLITRWNYSEAKALDESYAKALVDHASLKVKIIRYFNTVGPRQSSSYGMVIPTFFRAALSGEPLMIHGDGTQQRIFCHIEDAISGTLALWDAKSGFGEAFNLGGTEEISVLDLAKKILQMTNSKSLLQFVPYEVLKSQGFEDMKRRLPDTRKLRDLTKWSAKKGLNEILDDYYESIKQ